MQIDLSAIEDAELRKSIEDAVSALTDEVETLKAQLEEEPPDPLEKAAPEVKAMIEKEREEREKLQKELADERQERREAEFIAKAKPLGVVVGKAEEAGPLLASIADKAPEEYEKLEPMLKQAATLLNKSGLFKEFGAGEGEGETDPVQRRDAWVEKNRKDGETVAQARSRFWKENPEAVEEARS